MLHHLKPYKSNLLYALMLTLVCVLIELSFRWWHAKLSVAELRNKEYFTISMLFMFFSFLKTKVLHRGLLGLIGIFIFGQSVHFNFYGYFVFPYELILYTRMFKEANESLFDLPAVFIVPAILVLVYAAAVMGVWRLTATRQRLRAVDVLIIAFLSLMVYQRSTGERLGATPSIAKSVIKNSFYGLTYFLGKTLPDELSGASRVAPYYRESYPLRVMPQGTDTPGINTQGSSAAQKEIKPQTVVLIISESLTSAHMSLFGYQVRQTSPQLQAISKRREGFFFAKEAIASGMYTDTAIPMLLSIAYKPDPIPQIVSGRNSLFTMAKQQGYTTHFITTQRLSGMQYVRSLLPLPAIDHYFDPGEDNVSDDLLFEKLQAIDLTRKNFVVLGMRGSHPPYKDRIPPDYRPFGELKDLIIAYDTSAAYSDRLFGQIIDFLAEEDPSAVLIATSDHGQNVQTNRLSKGDFNNPLDYTVPFFFYSAAIPFPQALRQDFEHNEYTSHFNVSRLVGHFLGYDVSEADSSMTRDTYYVNGYELGGNAGFMTLEFLDGKIISRKQHY